MEERSGTQPGTRALEEQLRERTALLNHAQEIAGVGSWVWYPNDNRNEWSPQARRILPGSHRRTTIVISKHTPKPKVTNPPVRCSQMAISQKTASITTAIQRIKVCPAAVGM